MTALDDLRAAWPGVEWFGMHTAYTMRWQADVAGLTVTAEPPRRSGDVWTMLVGGVEINHFDLPTAVRLARAVVRELADDALPTMADAAVDAVLRIAHALGLSLPALGDETAGEVACLDDVAQAVVDAVTGHDEARRELAPEREGRAMLPKGWVWVQPGVARMAGGYPVTVDCRADCVYAWWERKDGSHVAAPVPVDVVLACIASARQEGQRDDQPSDGVEAGVTPGLHSEVSDG